MREAAKAVAHGLATIVVVPSLISFAIRRTVLGTDRALEGSTQTLSLVPGLAGDYLRRAFLVRTLAHCDRSATIQFGTIFSQAGARILYNFDRQLAASVRTTSDVGRRGGEVAAGVRVQPIGGLPLWFTAERRQRLGTSGRNAFALFAESGIYQRPMPWGLSLDAYVQGGVVGFRSRDMFVDGGMTFSRPLYRRFSGGLGLWGAAQPGVYRVDGGPRLTMRVRDNVRVHLDWRQRLAGNAEPGSGPAITLAGDF